MCFVRPLTLLVTILISEGDISPFGVAWKARGCDSRLWRRCASLAKKGERLGQTILSKEIYILEDTGLQERIQTQIDTRLFLVKVL